VRLVLVQVVALKPESATESARPVRHAEVVLFQPQGEVGARALVNLASAAVEQVIRLDGSQVPMTREDLADAFQLALRNEEVLKILGPTAKSYQVQSMSLTGTATPMENSVTGLRVRSSDEHRGEELILWSALAAAWYNYVIEWAFRDDGVVIGRVGATSSNSPSDPWETHMHNPIWRLDVDLNRTIP